MGKMTEWLLNFTRLGKLNDYLDGKKQMLAGLATALVATATIIMNVSNSETRLTYLLHIASTPEFIAASGGWVAFFNALKGEKIRAEIAAAPAADAPKP
jgi:hypothetical protein